MEIVSAETLTTAHSDDHEAVLEHLETSADKGLSADEAKRRLDGAGPNKLPEPAKPNVVVRYLKHFHDVLIYVLLGAAVVTAVLGHWVDTIVIAAVTIVNATIGFIQEGRADAALEGLRDMLSPTADVRRDGAWQEVEAEDIVPGDVVRLRSGDRVPRTSG